MKMNNETKYKEYEAESINNWILKIILGIIIRYLLYLLSRNKRPAMYQQSRQ